MSRPTTFVRRYGPWAVVAGASEGLGEQFARQLAARGLNLVLVARRQAKLEALAAAIRREHGEEVRPLCLDLSRPELGEAVQRATAELDLGLLVFNAALSPIGPFLEQDLAQHLASVDLNVRGPLVLCHLLGRRLVQRGRGGILLMTSLAGMQGSALISSYAASRAYNLVLAESLWDELRAAGVDVMACAAGATRTPNYLASLPDDGGSGSLKPEMEPEAVVRQALGALGKTPTLIPGGFNRLASLLLHRLLPRRLAVQIMGKNTRALYGG